MKMADVGKKPITRREAAVEARVFMSPSVAGAIKRNKIPKGDVLQAAKLAGIMAAKNTPLIIPLCHPISIDCAEVEFLFAKDGICVKTTVKSRARTGVEMEAFTAAAAACLTIYDMCKPLDRAITISEMRLVRKSGGKSGLYEIKKPARCCAKR